MKAVGAAVIATRTSDMTTSKLRTGVALYGQKKVARGKREARHPWTRYDLAPAP
jgi:hypothetical protein